MVLSHRLSICAKAVLPKVCRRWALAFWKFLELFTTKAVTGWPVPRLSWLVAVWPAPISPRS